MRLGFLGTPQIAVPSLEALVMSHHDVVAVVTRPDKPAGRRRELAPPAVKIAAESLGLPVLQPPRARESVDELSALGVEALAVVAYGGWLPPPVLELAPHGCINVHPSLLPRWRGAAPVERAIMAGDTVTGVATMAVDEGLDTGPVYLEVEHPIRPDDTASTLADRLARLGADLLLATLDGIERGSLRPVPQARDGATYADKLEPDECRVDWSRPAREVDARIRGANPRPGAWTTVGDRRLKLWRSALGGSDAGAADPGTVLSAAPLLVAAGDGTTVELTELQPDGRPRMDGVSWARGHGGGSGPPVTLV